MSLANIYKTLCDGLGLSPVNGSYVQALGNYFGVVDNPNRRYEDEVLVQALINSGGPGTSEVLIFDAFTDFPLAGDSGSLYVAKDANIIYRYDDTLNTYVILNDPNVIDPDAPEEGGTFFARLATNGALNACTYSNGTGGVGATLTGNINGIVSQNNQTGRIDNVVPALGDVILVKNQSSTIQNGLYEITTLGDGSNPFVLTRIDGYDQTSEVYPSAVFISQGTANGNRFFNQSTVNPVIGTNGLVYAVATVNPQALPVLMLDTATSAALPACTYTSGTAYPTALPGFGAYLEANANGALGTINNVTLTSGMRILVNNQADQTQNGSYTVTNAGSLTQKWRLTRWSMDTAARYQSREYLVNNPDSTLFGSRYTLTSPVNILNTQWGTENIQFSRSNNEGLRTADGNVFIDNQDGGQYLQLDFPNNRTTLGSSNHYIDMWSTIATTTVFSNGNLDLTSNGFNINLGSNTVAMSTTGGDVSMTTTGAGDVRIDTQTFGVIASSMNVETTGFITLETYGPNTNNNVLLQNDSKTVRVGSHSSNTFANRSIKIESSESDAGAILITKGSYTLTNDDDVIVNNNLGNAIIRANSDLNLISENGNINLSPLPTSDVGLSSGDLFTQTSSELGGTGTTKVICIV